MGWSPMLFDHAKILPDLDEGLDSLVKMLFLVSGGELHADTGLSLRNDRIVETCHEYAFLGHSGRKILGEFRIVEHNCADC